MNSSENNDMSRLEELMVDEILHGLDLAETSELATLGHPDELIAEYASLESAAAFIHSAFLDEGELEEMPSDLCDRIIQSARFAAPALQPDPAPKKAAPFLSPEFLLPMSVAAAVLIAIGGVFAFSSGSGAQQAKGLATAAERFEYAAVDLKRSDWSTVEANFAKVSGHVTWSPAKQRGYMHLTGLPKNDPSKTQYQLWIVDGDRTGAPVDGGVFDINSDGTVVVTIDPKLNVSSAKAFVITEEVPGGVVVSDGPHLVLAGL